MQSDLNQWKSGDFKTLRLEVGFGGEVNDGPCLEDRFAYKEHSEKNDMGHHSSGGCDQ